MTEANAAASAAPDVVVPLLGTLVPPSGPELVLVRVEAGEFTMGSDAAADEEPVHRHPMPRGYWIARDPITWAQYLAFCERDRAPPPARAAVGHARRSPGERGDARGRARVRGVDRCSVAARAGVGEGRARRRRARVSLG
ncbi:MAG: SUMF1/EgtB/PvdO family nonheme iron enzyme [Nannocystaceae bacterium]